MTIEMCQRRDCTHDAQDECHRNVEFFYDGGGDDIDHIMSARFVRLCEDCQEALMQAVETALHGAWDGVAPTPRFKVGNRVVGDGLSGVVERVLAEPSYTVRTRDGSMEGVPESELRHAEESDHG